MEVLLFGRLAEIAGLTALNIDWVKDSDQLKQKVLELFPAIAAIPFRIAVDKKIISETTTLQASSMVALLPPFSGG
jgi:molybdopterin synthase sulfur carrier subunit